MTAEFRQRLNDWAKLAAILLPMVGMGLIGWGALRSDVQHIQTRMSEELVRAGQAHETMKTDMRREVSLELQAIAAELREVNRRLDRIERGNR